MNSIRTFVALLVALSSASARAAHDTQAYERELIEESMRKHGLQVAQRAEGEKIHSIVIERFEVFLPRDGVPVFLNRLHWLSKEEMVRRELLFRADDPWRADYAFESERILRRLLPLQSARIVPARDRDGRLIALVVTQDLWSLRTEWSFSYVNGVLESLYLDLVEINLLGRGKQLGPRYQMDLARAGFGGSYEDFRVMGSDYRLTLSGDGYFSRESGANEGGAWSVGFDRPLYTLDSEWSYGLLFSGASSMRRLFQNGSLLRVAFPETGGTVPFAYRGLNRSLDFFLTRSYGRASKVEWSLGYTLSSNEYQGPSVDFGAPSVALFNDRYLPYNDRYGALSLTFRAFRADFIRLMDVDTFALTEDFRQGPSLSAQATVAQPFLGYDARFVQGALSLTWNEQVGADQLLGAALSASRRYQPSRQAELGSVWVNERASFSFRHVSARWKLFRFFTGMRTQLRDHDLNKTQELLGGNNVLRGFASNAFAGRLSLSGNFEARTEPMRLLSLYTGLAAFYDVGDAFDRIADFSAKHSVGIGIRVLIPQFNRAVIRADVGFPVTGGFRLGAATVEFGQAF